MADENENGSSESSSNNRMNPVMVAVLCIAFSLGLSVGLKNLSGSSSSSSSSTSATTSLSGNVVPATATSSVTAAETSDGTSVAGAASTATSATTTSSKAEGSPSEPVDVDPEGTWPATGSWVRMDLNVLTLRVADGDTYRCSLVSTAGTTFVQATMDDDAADAVRSAMAAAGDGLGTVTVVGRVAGTTSLGSNAQHVLGGCTVTTS